MAVAAHPNRKILAALLLSLIGLGVWASPPTGGMGARAVGSADSLERRIQAESESALYPNIRHPEIGFATRQKLLDHFEKHGREFGRVTLREYLLMAQDLRDRPKGAGVLEFVRRDGVATRFDRKSGAFLALNRDRTIRTFFKPNDGEAYFQRQRSREPR
jgi:hypothetical protein